MAYADVTELPQDVRDLYSDECLAVFLEACNAAEDTDEEMLAAGHAAARECEAADTDEAGADDAPEPEPDCGCAHVNRTPVLAGRRGTKVLPLEEAAVSEAGEFSGYANVFGIVDDGGDKVLKGAFKSAIPAFLKEGFISWGHDWNTPVAMPIAAKEDDHGLLITAQFHGTPTAQEARQITTERLAKGLSMGLSIGYEVGDSKDTTYGRDIASFKRLFETGLVLVPMNRPSTVTAAKGSLGSGKPFAERLVLVLAQTEAIERELKWLAVHSRQRAALRLKEGRVLSSANRERLATLKTSLSAVLRDIEELLRSTDPDRDKAAVLAVRIEAERTLARLHQRAVST